MRLKKRDLWWKKMLAVKVSVRIACVGVQERERWFRWIQICKQECESLRVSVNMCLNEYVHACVCACVCACLNQNGWEKGPLTVNRIFGWGLDVEGTRKRGYSQPMPSFPFSSKATSFFFPLMKVFFNKNFFHPCVWAKPFFHSMMNCHASDRIAEILISYRRRIVIVSSSYRHRIVVVSAVATAAVASVDKQGTKLHSH